MKKKPSSKKIKSLSSTKDAMMLGGLYLLSFAVFQMVNFIGASVKYESINIEALKTKFIAQLMALLAAYFITLIYIKSRSNS